MRTWMVLLFGLILFDLIAVTAKAQMPPGPMGGPPPQAKEACQGKSQGTACSFDAPLGKITGHCRNLPEGLLCVPDNGRRPPTVRNGNSAGRMMAPPTAGGQGHHSDAHMAYNPDAVPIKSKVPDTGQGSCFNASQEIICPKPGQPYYGQDAQYIGAAPAYRDNDNGTVTDLVTGLMWQQAHNAKRLGYYPAKSFCEQLALAGHHDWRLPTIKELFSISDYRGVVGQRSFLNDVFQIEKPSWSILQGDPFASTHRPDMMGQTWSSTIYTGVHYGRPGVEAAFFYNFLDGRIKQAPTNGHNKLFYRCVRGPEWGQNQFVKRGKDMVEDQSTGLTWQQRDDGKKRDWPQALAYCEGLKLGGLKWRLPNVKELETIVDYKHHNPAIDNRYFSMTDPTGWFWSSTTLGENVTQAMYVCFGACTDINGLDVHGAGAARSDPKVGNPADYTSQGGQHDAIRIDNYVRCVH